MSNYLKFLKFCHYALYCITFICLLVSCYFLYMHEAILKSRTGAMTIIKRSEERQFEAPSLIICPEPGFKPSVTEKYNLTNAPRYVFRFEKVWETFHTQQTMQGV